MRLICPNCGAQYEVDDSVIPEAGRDVQCSGCGQTWFQPSAAMIEAAEIAAAAAAPAMPEGWDFDEETGSAEPTTGPEAEAPPAAAGSAATAPADSATGDDDFSEALAAMLAENAATADDSQALPPETEPEAAPQTAPQTAPGTGTETGPETSTVTAAPAVGAVPRRPLDNSLLAILREEAERETAARRAEGSGLETQEEMNLEPVTAAAAASRAAAKLASAPAALSPAALSPATPEAPAAGRRPARRSALDFSDLNDEAEDYAADLSEGPLPPAQGGSRRQMLPDIEEINSSLRASADRSGDAAAQGTPQLLARRRSGFRFGFLVVIALAALAMLLYSFAPLLGTRMPALVPLLDAYVTAVNSARQWLDAALRGLIERMQGPGQRLS